MRDLSTGVDPARRIGQTEPSVPWPPKGQVVDSIVVTHVAMVSGPGRR